MNEQELRSKGWRKQSDGSWSRPKRSDSAVGKIQAGDAKQTPSSSLDGGKSKQKGGVVGLGARISLVAFRNRLLDSDNCEASFKHLRDAIADTLGINDGSGFYQWETGQVRTDGEEGVLVKIEIL